MEDEVAVPTFELAEGHGHPSLDVSGEEDAGAVLDDQLNVRIQEFKDETEVLLRGDSEDIQDPRALIVSRDILRLGSIALSPQRPSLDRSTLNFCMAVWQAVAASRAGCATPVSGALSSTAPRARARALIHDRVYPLEIGKFFGLVVLSVKEVCLELGAPIRVPLGFEIEDLEESIPSSICYQTAKDQISALATMASLCIFALSAVASALSAAASLCAASIIAITFFTILATGSLWSLPGK